MAEPATLCDRKILEVFRNTIIQVMNNYGYNRKDHYRISEAKEEKPLFRMELLAADLTAPKVRSILKVAFYRKPKVVIVGSFIQLDFSQLYEYTVEQK